jgi:hypothetical protein
MKTLIISDETYELIKNQLNQNDIVDITGFKDLIGKAFFFRTVTYHLTGRIKNIVGNMAILEDAAWIADSGRFMEAIKKGILKEVEPVGIAFINLSSITDMFPWNHPLPMEQK